MNKPSFSRDEWEDHEGLDLKQVWAVIYRRKWSIIALAVAISLVTALAVYTTTPIYRAAAIVHIQSGQANIVSIEEIYGLDSRGAEYYNTQVQILKSRPIGAKVIKDIGPNPPTAPSRMSFDWRSMLPFQPPAPPGGEVRADPIEKQVSSYLGGLTIEPVDKTQLVRIQYESPDPRRAAEAANAHADAYIESMLDARLSTIQSASSWMAERVDELGSKLRDSEAQLQAFRESEKLIDVDGVQALPSMQINDLTARLVDARRRLSTARISYLQVYGDDSEDIESVPAILRNTAVQQFRQTQATAEQRVAELSKRYGPKHPSMIAAQSELAQATDNLNSQQQAVSGGIRAEYLAAQSELRALENELDDAKQQFQEVSSKGAELSELKREVDTNRDLYELFYSRMRETAQTGDLDSVNARVVQAAITPTVPIKPRKKAAIMMAFAFGLAAGIGAAFLLEQLNQTIRSSGEVEEKTGLPLLGTVPALGKKASKEAATASLAEGEVAFAEAIRTIRTGLSLSDIDNPDKVIFVTSSLEGEGKTTVAINLALAFASVERVLLIDADMRRPSIAKELNLDRNSPGLPELLSGNANLNKCITFRDDVNLEILKTSTIPPDPLRLLLPASFSKVMQTLRSTYDRIIIDGPPVLAVSDASVLSKHAESIVYVVKFDSTRTDQIKLGIQHLRKQGAPLTGVVLNQVDVRKAELYGDYSVGSYYGFTDSDESSDRKTRFPTAASL